MNTMEDRIIPGGIPVILILMSKTKTAKDHGVKTLGFVRKGISGPAFSLFIFFLVFYYFTNAGWYKGGDEAAMRLVAMSIAERGKISFQLMEPINKSSEADIVKGADGSYYFKFGLGQSLVEVPFYLLHQLISLSSPVTGEAGQDADKRLITEFMVLALCPSMVSAFGCALIFWLGLRLKFSRRNALLVSLIYGFGTMVWPYSKSLMSEATLNVAILGGVYGAVSYVSTGRPVWMLVSGFFLGFAFITKPVSCLVIPVVILYVVRGAPSRRALFHLALGLGIPLAGFVCLQLWHNAIRYGSILQFGYNAGRDRLGFATPLYIGLWGLFASPGKSFFLYTPVSLLSFACMGSFFKRHRLEALLFLGICVVTVVTHALWWAWPGDWAWGPRFLLVITPYLILPLGVFFEAWHEKSALKRALVIFLIVFSVWVQVLGVTIHPYSYILTRTDVIERYINLDPPVFTYAWAYDTNTFSHFSPVFSHLVGNWWLFKHMVSSYDLWSDVPWSEIGNFHLGPPLWVRDGRTIPFWWPVAIPVFYPRSGPWVYPMASAIFLMAVWWGLRLLRAIRRR